MSGDRREAAGQARRVGRDGSRMSSFELALLIGLIVAALASWRDWRALVWLAAGAADYIITSMYFYANLPYHPAFTLLVDASVCAAIWFTWQQRWEKILYQVFLLSVAFDLLKFFNVMGSHAFATALEVANWLAILVIGGPHILEHIGWLLDAWGTPSGRVRRAYMVCTAAREDYSRKEA